MADTRSNQVELDELKSEISQLRSDFTELLSTMKNVGTDSAQYAKSKTQSELDDLLDQLNQAYNAARREGRQASRTVQSEIEERPITSLALAFIVGLMTGKLFSTK